MKRCDVVLLTNKSLGQKHETCHDAKKANLQNNSSMPFSNFSEKDENIHIGADIHAH